MSNECRTDDEATGLTSRLVGIESTDPGAFEGHIEDFVHTLLEERRKRAGSLAESVRIEELEALRLADLEGLSQSEASSGMGVSRHTFGRVLASARKKVALSLVNNIPLVVTGGTNSCRRESGELLKEHPAMKIAISAEGPTLEDDVDPRFGRAAGFIIYDTETKAVEYIENGAGQTAAQGAGLIAVETVSNAGATVALSGYIGPKAFDALQAIGIGTVQDVDNRTVGEVVRAFEAGELTVILPSNKEA